MVCAARARRSLPWLGLAVPCEQLAPNALRDCVLQRACIVYLVVHGTQHGQEQKRAFEFPCEFTVIVLLDSIPSSRHADDAVSYRKTVAQGRACEAMRARARSEGGFRKHQAHGTSPAERAPQYDNDALSNSKRSRCCL